MIYCAAKLGGRKDGEIAYDLAYQKCVVKNKWEHQVLQQEKTLLKP